MLLAHLISALKRQNNCACSKLTYVFSVCKPLLMKILLFSLLMLSSAASLFFSLGLCSSLDKVAGALMSMVM